MKFLKTLALIMAMLIGFSAFAACGGNEDDDTNSSDSQIPIIENEFILNESVSQYTIVLPEGATAETALAGQELQNFFFEATNINLPITNDENLTHTQDSRYISIGKTTLYTSAGITTESDNLGASGFKIVTKDKSVFIVGDTDKANCYGVYGFLEQTVNYDWVSRDCFAIDRNVTTIPLAAYDIVDIPDIEYRGSNYGFITSDALNMTRFRFEPQEKWLTSFGGAQHSTTLYVLPMSEHYEKHPKWYSADKTQVSFVANGDEEELELMIEEVANVYKREIVAQPRTTIGQFSISDSPTFDNCPAQRAITAEYGAASASVILFLNRVREKIDAWFETDGAQYKRDYEIHMLAYLKTEQAPVEWNESKKCYEGVNGIRFADGVGVEYAPIYIDYLRDLYHPINKEYLTGIEQWTSISNHMMLWTYNVNFKDYLLPYDTFNGMPVIYKKAKESGVKWMLNQSQLDSTTVPSAWCALKAYLDKELSWDCEQDPQQLIEKFFDVYYGKASDTMMEAFLQFRVHSEYLKDNVKGYSENYSCEARLLVEQFWPKRTLLNWYDIMTSALDDIEYLKVVDMDQYVMFEKRILNERLSLIFMLVELYNHTFSDQESLDYKLTFKNDHTYIGGGARGTAGMNGESGVPSLLEKWGVK